MNRFAIAAALVLSSSVALVAPAYSLDWATNGAVSLTSGSFAVSQSSGSVVITAVRQGGKTGAYSVTYKTVNSSASAPANYTTETGTIKWASGDNSAKTFTIPVNTSNVFSGTKSFAVRLTADANTMLGAHGSATITITGGSAPTAPTTPVVVTKSIKQWVTCSETIDESNQLAAALTAAANNAFELLIDCPVRFHTGTASNSSITVPDGVTVKFSGEGEFLTVSNGPKALKIAHPNQVTFVNYNQTYL
jgi:hypothetical protein